MFALYDDPHPVPVKDELFQLPSPDQKDCGLCSVTEFGHESAGHSHYLEHKGSELYLCGYTAGGEGELHYRGHTIRLQAGDLFFLSLAHHTVLRPMTDDLDLYFFYMDGAPVHHVYEQFSHSKTHVLHSFAHDKVHLLYEQLVLTTRDVQDKFARSKVLFSFLTEVLSAAEQHRMHAYSSLIADALRYLDEHCDASVRTVADALGYNPIYLERKFKAETGITLKQYILQMRYDLACARLRTTDQSVEEIARALGYHDSMGLLFLFRKLAGTTPLAYRKQFRRRK